MALMDDPLFANVNVALNRVWTRAAMKDGHYAKEEWMALERAMSDLAASRSTPAPVIQSMEFLARAKAQEALVELAVQGLRELIEMADRLGSRQETTGPTMDFAKVTSRAAQILRALSQ